MSLQVQVSASEGALTNRLVCSRGHARVQIETSPVMRGTVHPVRRMQTQPAVQEEFGFAQIQVLDFADLYAGKLAAALSRQHPRDLFDLGPVLDGDRLDGSLWRTALVYLTSNSKPISDLLAPGEPKNFEETFERQFRGMTRSGTSVEALLDIRTRTLERVAELMDESCVAFLESVEQEAPDFALIGLPQAADLPATRRKLQNLLRRSDEKRQLDRRNLAAALTQLAARFHKRAGGDHENGRE